MLSRYTALKAAIFACALGLLFPFPTIAALESEPRVTASEKSESLKAKEDYARHFAQMVLAIVQDTKKSFDDRKGVLRTAFSKSVDIDWIARFVLGNGWARANAEQRERYMDLYRKYLTESYVANFAENPDKRIRDIKIFNVNETNEQDFTVRTEMMLADMENLKVNYLVNDNDTHYKVRDIVIENVSLITTHRSEFSRLATDKGVDGVITELQHRLEVMKKEEDSYPTSHAPQLQR